MKSDTHSLILKIDTELIPFARLCMRSLSPLKKSKTGLCLPKRTRRGRRTRVVKRRHLLCARPVLSTLHTTTF